MKTFALICTDFGRKFTFNAKDQKEAQKKLVNYEIYHSVYGHLKVVEVNEKNPKDLRNQWI